MSEERALRAALELAQSRVKDLELENADLLDALEEEQLARDLAEAELAEVRLQLEDAQRVPMAPPGENKEMVRLRARVMALEELVRRK